MFFICWFNVIGPSILFYILHFKFFRITADPFLLNAYLLWQNCIKLVSKNVFFYNSRYDTNSFRLNSSIYSKKYLYTVHLNFWFDTIVLMGQVLPVINLLLFYMNVCHFAKCIDISEHILAESWVQLQQLGVDNDKLKI